MRITDRRALVLAIIYGVLLGIGMCIGYTASHFGEIRITDPVAVIAFLVSAAVGCVFVYIFLRKYGAHRQNADAKDVPASSVKLCPALTFGIVFICWVPVFLAEFPGFFVYDAADEYVSVATREFTTHHPLLHTLLLGGAVRAGEVYAGSANAGIAAYILIQMVIMALLFTWIIHRMRRAYVFGLLWYGLFPTVVMFVLCSVKDTLFAGALTAAVILAVIWLKGHNKNRRDFVLMLLALYLMMLMRHNGVYAYIVFACILSGYFAATNKCVFIRRIAPALCMAAVLVIYGVTDMGLTALTHASDAEHQEMLSVPIQQIARTWNKYPEDFSEGDRTVLHSMLSEDTLKHYTPELSDPVKSGFDNSAYEASPALFWQLWFKQLGLHPGSYLNAWIDTSYGYYYPLAVVNVYAGHSVYTYTYTESSYFGYEVEYPGERLSLIPVIDRFYRWLSLDDDIQRIPVLSLFFSMGALLWFYMFCVAVFIYRRSCASLIGLSLPLAVMMTLLLGPTFLPRYTVFWWFLFPFYVNEVFYETGYYARQGS